MAIYEYTARVRYNEVDERSSLSDTALLDLLQNCSTFQCEDMGIGVEYYKEIGRAWVLSAWQIAIDRRPKLGETLRIQTWSTGIKRALGSRNYRVIDAEGQTVVSAYSLWAYIDTSTMLMAECPQNEIDLYGISEALPMKVLPRRIKLMEDMTAQEPIEVKYYFIDTNHHMNNAKYVMAAEEFLPEGFETKTIRVEYIKSARLGDVIYPRTHVSDEAVTVCMADEEGNTYATVQFLA
ncbi:MAG: acyl-[acyl-carrier-protein] thioesterase [Lachnospiraceae bacterium]|nr:acyl-[acyl-carrier-protein] thioesterase [Lachnospiraceae bacterium]